LLQTPDTLANDDLPQRAKKKKQQKEGAVPTCLFDMGDVTQMATRKMRATKSSRTTTEQFI
jgi:hypothetical protein